MWILQYLKSMGDNFGLVGATRKIEYGTVYRGAEPSYSRLIELRQKYGIRTILDLRRSVNQTEEEVRMRAAELRYYWIPMVDNDRPTDLSIKTCLDILQIRGNENIFVHCEGGRHRTSLVCACYLVAVKGWSKADAWKENEHYGWYGAQGHEPLKDYFFEDFQVGGRQ